MTLWPILCRATQEGWIIAESSDKMRRQTKPYAFPETLMVLRITWNILFSPNVCELLKCLFCYWSFNSGVVREVTLYDLNLSHILSTVLWLRNFQVHLKRMYISLLYCSVKARWPKLIDSIVQVFCILTDFLTTYSVSYWENNGDITDCTCEFVCFELFVWFETLL